MRDVIVPSEQLKMIRQYGLMRLGATDVSLKFKLHNEFVFVRVIVLILLIVNLFGSQSAAQTPTSDPQAISLAAETLSAMTSGSIVNDITLSGSATADYGTTDTGTIVLRALGAGESRMDLTLSEGVRTEIRDASTGIPQGSWTSPNGKSGMFAAQNNMTDAVWFFPIFSSLSGSGAHILSYVGLETWNGQSVQHIRSCAYQSSVSNNLSSSIQQLSTMDFYLNAATLLPATVVFTQHPDNDINTNITMEVDYSDYQVISGITLPMNIHETMNGAAFLDIQLTSVFFNTGLSMSEFSIS